MKISKRPRTGPSGSTLVMTVVLTGLIGFTLASYLTLVKTQNLSSMRSQAWNATMPIVEAGLEEALTHLNRNGTNRLDADGWRRDGNLYWIKRDLPTGFNIVTISNWWGPGSPRPLVESRGYVDMPLQVVTRTDTLMAAGSWNPAASGLLSRGVAAVAKRDALFARGMVAKGQIDLHGNNIATDSFDSRDPNHSNGGLYDPTKRKDNGHVATNSGVTNSLSIGNANIYGRVSTGPGGSVAYGPNGAVGDLAWHASGGGGIQPGWSSDDMNVDFPDVDPPFGGGAWAPTPGMVNGETYDYVLGSANYQMSSLSMSSSKKMIVVGDAILYVTGNASLSGQAQIQIAPGGSLKLYVGGTSANLSGNGVINDTGFAENFRYFGLPSNQQVSLGGNAAFVGVIYAPQASFTLFGGGGDGRDFIGASITDTVQMNGHFKFHYDEALADLGPDNGYIVDSWNELNPTSVTDLPDSILIALGFIEGTIIEAGDPNL